MSRLGPSNNIKLAMLCSISRFTNCSGYYFPPELMEIVYGYLVYPLEDCEIHDAVGAWFMDPEACIERYGHISYWDTSKVTSMRNLFEYESETMEDFDLPLYWDTSNVEDMEAMFAWMPSFTGKGLEVWDVQKVRTMARMFEGTPLTADLSCWQTKQVINMAGMFRRSSFNGSINTWDVGRVWSMVEMFKGNAVFNQPLDQWRMRNLLHADGMFLGCVSFNQDLKAWKLPRGPSVERMFWGASSFNQSVGDWDRCLANEVVLTADMFEESGSK